MELRVLRYFLPEAQEENIAKAAALLHLTQPTLSRQLMHLEDELSVKLFRRSQYIGAGETRRMSFLSRTIVTFRKIDPKVHIPHLQCQFR